MRRVVRGAILPGMTFADVTIPGVAGPLSTQGSFWKGLRFSVAGERVKAHGFPRNKLTLPGTDGPVEAKVKGGFFRPYPSFVVGAEEYPTGPPTPRSLQVLGWSPLVGVAIVQGVVGFLLAFGGMALSMGIIRSERRVGLKVALMTGVLVAVIGIDLAIAVAAYSISGA